MILDITSNMGDIKEESCNDTKKTAPFMFRHDMSRDDLPPDITHLVIDTLVSKIGLFPTREPNNNKIGLDINKIWAEWLKKGRQGHYYCWSSRQYSQPTAISALRSQEKNYLEGHFFGYLSDLESVQVLSRDAEFTIGPFAFLACTFLKDISVPSTLVSIGQYAFAHCRYLVNIDLSSTCLQVIEEWAFYECESLKGITIPCTVTIIGHHAFYSCSSLVDLLFDSHSCLKEIQEYAFWKCKSLCAVSIPSSTNLIDKCAFADCISLLGVEFDNTTKVELGPSCFAGCTSLVNMCLPSSPSTKIGSLAFAECPYKPKDFIHRLNGPNLSVHNVCYHASTLTTDLDQFKALVVKASSECVITDHLGMTPFHIFATLPSLRSDVLQVLLDNYPWNVLAHKDKRNKTVVDYLLLNESPRAIPLILQILKHVILSSRRSRWNRFQSDVMTKMTDPKQWQRAQDALARRKMLDKVLKLLVSHTKIESTSILEESLWKRTILESTFSKNGKEDHRRQQCRIVCGANIVLPNVVGYLWSADISYTVDDDDDDDIMIESSPSLPRLVSDDLNHPPELITSRHHDDSLSSLCNKQFATDLLPPEVSWLQGVVEPKDDWDIW